MLEKTESQQIEAVDAIALRLKTWAVESGSRVHVVHATRYPGIGRPLSLTVFFESDADIVEYNNDGTKERIKNQASATAFEMGCAKYFEPIVFFFDSHENVVKTNGGSYYYLLR